MFWLKNKKIKFSLHTYLNTDYISEYRSEILETMRAATTKSPDIAFNLGSQWVQHILEQPLNIGEGKLIFMIFKVRGIMLNPPFKKLRLSVSPSVCLSVSAWFSLCCEHFLNQFSSNLL